MIKTRISIDPESILFLCSHVHPIIHTYRETRFSRQRAIDRRDAAANL